MMFLLLSIAFANEVHLVNKTCEDYTYVVRVGDNVTATHVTACYWDEDKMPGEASWTALAKYFLFFSGVNLYTIDHSSVAFEGHLPVSSLKATYPISTVGYTEDMNIPLPKRGEKQNSYY